MRGKEGNMWRGVVRWVRRSKRVIYLTSVGREGWKEFPSRGKRCVMRGSVFANF